MHPQRWERIWDVFEQARAAPPEKRTAYVSTVCGADTALRAEVESLLLACCLSSFDF